MSQSNNLENSSKAYFNYMKNDSIPDKVKRDIALNDLGYAGKTLSLLQSFGLGTLSTLLVIIVKFHLEGPWAIILYVVFITIAFISVSVITRRRAIKNLLTIEQKIRESTNRSDTDKSTTCRCVKINFHEADHSLASESASSTACGSGLVINLCLTQARSSDVSALANVNIEVRS